MKRKRDYPTEEEGHHPISYIGIVLLYTIGTDCYTRAYSYYNYFSERDVILFFTSPKRKLHFLFFGKPSSRSRYENQLLLDPSVVIVHHIAIYHAHSKLLLYYICVSLNQCIFIDSTSARWLHQCSCSLPSHFAYEYIIKYE